MKRLTLVRHAKSSWSDPRVADHDRVLSQRGERDAPRMGRRLRARKARPSLILSSPAVRALETARIIAVSLGYPRDFPQTERALYHADPGTLFDIVWSRDDSSCDMMIVGHNPGLTWFVNELLTDFAVDNLPTTGIVAIAFDAGTWQKADAASASLDFYDYPKNPAAVPEDV